MYRKSLLAHALTLALGGLVLSTGAMANGDQDNDGISDAVEIGSVPASCTAAGFLTNSADELYTVDLGAEVSTLVYTFPVTVNGIGFNPYDEKLWASSSVTSATGGYLFDPVTFEQVGTFPLTWAHISGDINTIDKTYVGARSAGDPVVVIDADPSSATYLTQIGSYDSLPVTMPDIVFDASTGLFYGIAGSSNELYSLDPGTGAWTLHGEVTGLPASTYGAGFSIMDGRMYFSSNETGDIYQIDVNDANFSTAPSASLFTGGPATGANDGARCTFVDLNGDPIPVDSDGDGTPDYLDTDSDDDGLPDSLELTLDTDSDGVADFQDADADGAASLDDDGDGISNGEEVLVFGTSPTSADTDGDGLTDSQEINDHGTDPTDPDTDGGGATDGAEVAIGTDPLSNDVDDTRDTDVDGLSDFEEFTIGTDPDNADSDNDGLEDGREINHTGTDPSSADTDGDGLDDAIEVELYLTDPTQADTDGDQLSDEQEVREFSTDPLMPDTDNDGLDDGAEVTTTLTAPLEADTDRDGLTDGEEVNSLGTDPLQLDTDSGGAPDGREVASGTDPLDAEDDIKDLDSDDDGIPDAIEGYEDQDADGIPNYLDRDSDNDGITDTTEAGGIDQNGDGIIDGFTDSDLDGIDDQTAGSPLAVPDTDGDGLADFLDADSDQDGLSDIFEAGGVDADDDGQVDNFTDTDGDGIDDVTAASPLVAPDTDNDSVPNYRDLDSDNDGTSDLVESGTSDTDGNGMVDLFLDSDLDGIPDQADVDTTQGSDADGDGIDDLADIDQTAGADINGNGIDDAFEPDADGDGRANAIANDASTLPDADGDGIPDVIDGAAGASADLVTGVNGVAAGCSIIDGKPGPVDPLLPLSLLASLGVLTGRASRRRKHR